MPRIARAPQVISSAGLAAAYTAPDAGLQESVVYNARRVLHVKNTSGSTITVTLLDPQLVDGQAAPNRVVSILTATDQFIGMQSGVYLQTDGTVWINYSASAGVVAAALEV